MNKSSRDISKEVYERAMSNGGYITSEDMNKVFSIADLCGYGIYMPMVDKIGEDKYVVKYYRGSSCD